MLFWPFNHYPGTDYETFNWEWLIKLGKRWEDIWPRVVEAVERATSAAAAAEDSENAAHEYSNMAIAYGSKYFRTPEMHGAVGDGVTDDSQAVLDAFNYCKNNPGWILLLDKEYHTPGLELTYDSPVNMIINGSIDEITAYFNSGTRTTAWIKGSKIGTLTIYGAKGFNVDVNKITTFILKASNYVTNAASCAFNSFHGTDWDSVTVASEGLTAWNNENKFTDMDITSLKISSDKYQNNTNQFINVGLENSTVILQNARNNYIKARAESIGPIQETNSFDNRIETTYQSNRLAGYGLGEIDQGGNTMVYTALSDATHRETLVSDTIDTVYHNDNDYEHRLFKLPSWSNIHDIYIPLNCVGSVKIISDVKIFRLKVRIEDDQGNNITQRTDLYAPATGDMAKFHSASMTYDAVNQVYDLASDLSHWFVNYSRSPGDILHITVRTGAADNTPTFLKIINESVTLSSAIATTIYGTLKSASSTPTNTNAPLGTIVQNRTGSNKGWVLTTNGWEPI